MSCEQCKYHLRYPISRDGIEKKNSSWNLLETERGKRINKLITRKTDFNALETRTKLFFNEHI